MSKNDTIVAIVSILSIFIAFALAAVIGHDIANKNNDKEQRVIATCVENDMQWVDGSCVTKGN